MSVISFRARHYLVRATPRLACAALAVWLCTGSAETQSSGDVIAYVDSVISASVTAHRTAGASIAVVKAGRVIMVRGYGLADLENDVPATEQTVYRIGSVTKQFTAAAIMTFAPVRHTKRGKFPLQRCSTPGIS